MDWIYTTDKAGRNEKEYYPYTIAKDGNDEYRSILWEYDRASRRTKFSDPTFGHKAADTSGWDDNTEPTDETGWVTDTPQHFGYGVQGNLVATGRVAGKELMSGEGEPYFVDRDNLGRVSRVIYPDATDADLPQMEMRYEYAADGQVSRISAESVL